MRQRESGFRAIGFKGIQDHHVTTPRAVSSRFEAVGLRLEDRKTLDFPIKGHHLYYVWLLGKPCQC